MNNVFIKIKIKKIAAVYKYSRKMVDKKAFMKQTCYNCSSTASITSDAMPSIVKKQSERLSLIVKLFTPLF